METFSSALTYMREFNALNLQDLFFRNVDIVGYVITFYVVIIVKGPQWLYRFFGDATLPSAAPASFAATNGSTVVEKSIPMVALLDRFMVFWHSLMAIVPVITLAHVLPIWLCMVQKYGFYEAVCMWNDELINAGPVAFWMGVYTISKIPAVLDAVFVVLQNHLRGASDKNHPQHKPIRFYQWYHHSLLLAYFWHTFIIGTSVFVMFVMCNALAQTVVWICKIQLDVDQLRNGRDKVAGSKREGKMKSDRFHMYITAAYVAECITGAGVAMYGSYQNYYGPRGCMVMQANVRMCIALYTSCLYCIISDLRGVWKMKAEPSTKKQQ